MGSAIDVTEPIADGFLTPGSSYQGVLTVNISLRNLAPVVWMLSVYVCVFMCFFFLDWTFQLKSRDGRDGCGCVGRPTSGEGVAGDTSMMTSDGVSWVGSISLTMNSVEASDVVGGCSQRRQEFQRGKYGEWFGLCAAGGGLNTCGLRVTPPWGGSCGLVGVYLSAGFWIGQVHLCLQLTDTLFLLPRGTLRR